MIRIIQHETSVETRILGVDHQPYSYTALNVPPEVAEAARGGLGLNLSDFDCRIIEWREETALVHRQS